MYTGVFDQHSIIYLCECGVNRRFSECGVNRRLSECGVNQVWDAWEFMYTCIFTLIPQLYDVY